LKPLALLLLLIAAQQGAVTHEFSHMRGWTDASAQVRADAESVADGCALCPIFAQAASPPFNHAFALPLLDRAAADAPTVPRDSSVDATVPTHRSRGPPSIS
jgi:hypothetical protein